MRATGTLTSTEAGSFAISSAIPRAKIGCCFSLMRSIGLEMEMAISVLSLIVIGIATQAIPSLNSPMSSVHPGCRSGGSSRERLAQAIGVWRLYGSGFIPSLFE
jgi:hypothetical protein